MWSIAWKYRFDGPPTSGSREDSAHGNLEIYSAQSPLGKALTGKQKGETATYQLPNGREMSVEVIDIEPYTG